METIRRLRWRRVAVPFVAPLHNARDEYRVRESILVEAAAGHFLGVGEAALPPGVTFAHDGPAIDRALRELARQVVGKAPEAAWAHPDADQGYEAAWLPALRCGVETALADLGARTDGVPLANWLARRLQGPAPDVAGSIEVNGLVDLANPEAAAASAMELVRDGFRTVKLKVGGDPATALATVAAVRAAIGPHVELRCDANAAWSPEEAARFLEGCGPSNVALCEEPLAAAAAGAFRTLAALRRASPVPVAVDESVRTCEGLEAAIGAAAADCIVVKPMSSGLIEATAMLRRASAAGLPAIVTTTFDLAPGTALAMHLAAGLPGPRLAAGVATLGLVVNPLGRGVPPVREGRVTLTGTPGLGVDFDGEAFERYAAGPWEECTYE